MFGCRAHPLIAADDVGDFHRDVIDDVGEMIGGESIRFQKNLVVDISPGSCDAPFDRVFVNAFACEGDFKADHEGLARFFPFAHFFRSLNCGISGRSRLFFLVVAATSRISVSSSAVAKHL